VEALVGIGMLALIAASLVPFNRGLIIASERSDVLRWALDLAEQHLESGTLGDATTSAAHEDARHRLVSVLTPWDGGEHNSDACGSPSRGRIGGASVEVSGALGLDGPLLSLRSTRFERVRVRGMAPGTTTGGSTVLVDGIGLGGLAVIIEVGGAQMPATVGDDGCLELPALPPGRHVVRPLPGGEDSMLVDVNHRRADASTLEIDVLDRPVNRRWQIARAAELMVDIDRSSARPPDRVISGDLRWMLRGDDTRSTEQLGSARLVHPGRTTVVVSACGNPEAVGSSVTVDLEPGGALQVLMPLAGVTLYGVAGWEAEAIYAVRTTSCADGSGLRPAVRWEGGLAEGMRIALPHGEWEARIETIAGSRISSPVRVPAGEPGLAVTFP
jgi:hypothetical protein